MHYFVRGAGRNDRSKHRSASPNGGVRYAKVPPLDPARQHRGRADVPARWDDEEGEFDDELEFGGRPDAPDDPFGLGIYDTRMTEWRRGVPITDDDRKLIDVDGRELLSGVGFEEKIEQKLPPNWRVNIVQNAHFLQWATVLAFLTALATLLLCLIFYNAKATLTRVGGTVVIPEYIPSTISASITGYPNRAIVTAALPIYGFFRGIQIIGEFWSVVNKRIVHGSLSDFEAARDERRGAQYVASIVGAADVKRRPKPFHWAALVLHTLSQYCLILLLALTSTEAPTQHMIFTISFVVAYGLFGIFDAINHSFVVRRGGMLAFVFWFRAVLVVGIVVVGGIFAYVFEDDQITVAILEYFLGSFILLHGLLGVGYLRNMKIAVLYKPVIALFNDAPRGLGEMQKWKREVAERSEELNARNAKKRARKEAERAAKAEALRRAKEAAAAAAMAEAEAASAASEAPTPPQTRPTELATSVQRAQPFASGAHGMPTTGRIPVMKWHAR